MMPIALTDETGRWFDEDEAIKFDEDTRWDGQNRISVATGSQWEHERLFYTSSGVWVLRRWSQWQGSTESYEELTQDAATRWLSRNRCHDDAGFEALPEEVRRAVADGLAELKL